MRVTNARFKRGARLCTLLRQNASGVAMIEFAYAMPAVIAMGMYGVETANLAQTHLRVSQIALTLADNASRAGADSSDGTIQQLREIDINDVLEGARMQSSKLKLVENGRIILSSLETNASGGQWIHWQRCLGRRSGPAFDSHYGAAGQGATGTGFPGMGKAGEEVQAPLGEAVMFVEVNYQYQSLFGAMTSLIGTRLIQYTASYIVRDKRDLSGNGGAGIYDPAPSVGAAKLTCDKYTT